MPAHGRVSVHICTQHGLQDGGVFVAVNCPFVASLWALNSSLCCWLIKHLQTSHLTHMRTFKHRHATGGVGNGVIPTLEHKLKKGLTYSVTVDARMSLSLIQSGLCPQWSYLPVPLQATIVIKRSLPSMIGIISWDCRSVSEWHICILWPAAEGLQDWLGGRFLRGWRPETSQASVMFYTS